MKKLVVVIPARKGSKRLKNKNTLILGNKNLVERSIIFAKKLVKNNCIILSTDSDKILKIGKNLIELKWMAKIPTVLRQKNFGAVIKN